MISSAYSYYLSQYGRKSNAKYDTHTKAQLKSSYSKVLKSNSLAPTYKLDVSLKAQQYAIDLKEHARELSFIAKDLSDETSGEMSFKKSAQSSNPDAVEVTYTSDSSAPEVSSFNVAVSQLASNQVNTGNYLQPNTKLLKPGTYTFDLDINNITYEFEFNISDSETNKDVQNKLARLVNRSNIGIQAEVLTDSLGNSALSLASDATGISGIRPTIFNITSNNKELMDALGLDRVTAYPSNAVFSVNGDERFSTTNQFVINKAFEIKLNGITGENPATISIRTDGEAMVESINELISGYNNFIAVTSDYNNSSFEGNERLKKEFTSIVMAHRTTLNNNGLKVQDDGSVAVDKESILNAVDKGTLGNIFSELNDFKKAMQRKADDIAANPMNYVNNKIVAYKNPHKPMTDPYNLSAYTGMMFNGYV